MEKFILLIKLSDCFCDLSLRNHLTNQNCTLGSLFQLLNIIWVKWTMKQFFSQKKSLLKKNILEKKKKLNVFELACYNLCGRNKDNAKLHSLSLYSEV